MISNYFIELLLDSGRETVLGTLPNRALVASMGGVSHTLIVGNTSLCTYIDVYISGQAYSMKVNSEVAIHCCNPFSFFRYPTLKNVRVW